MVAVGEPLQAGAKRPIRGPTKTFLNLHLSARLGAAFGFLVLALIVVAAAGLHGVDGVNDDARQLSERDGRVVAVVGEGAKRTGDGVATVEQTREAFEVIGLAVESMTERVAEIAGAVQ